MNSFTLVLVIVLTVATLITSSSGYGFRIVQVPVCEGDDEFALHEDCTKYYICDNGSPVLSECPENLYFSPEVGYCDFPELVPDCIGGTRDPGTGPGTDPTIVPSEPPTNAPATTAAETDAPSTVIELTTTEAAEETTEPPVPTTEPPVPTTEPPVPTTEPEPEPTTSSGICPPEGFAFLPYPGSCKKYYICIDGTETVQECADGTLFDEALGRCNSEEDVDCKVIPTTAPPTTVPPTEPPTEAPTTAPPTDPPTRPPTTNPPTTDPPTAPPTTNQPVTCPVDGIDSFPDPSDCQKYTLCIDGVAYPETCSEGLLFDPVEKQCKPAEDVICFFEPNCPAEGISYLPVPGNCVQYIFCVAGEAYPKECAPGTEFDPQAQQCVLEESYDCPFRKLSAMTFLRRLRY